MDSQRDTIDWDDDCECLHPRSVMEARWALGEAATPEAIAEIFATLGDPTRMRVLIALGDRELCVTDLAAATGVNRTTISHQLRVLRQRRIVRRRRAGKVVYYALDDDHITALLRLASAHVGEAPVGLAPDRVSA
ncbi:MAG TPA: metalloregulator ArsR/SmtB family transcription factor [Thermomicrobiales bacterium]|nr:metalloregulator ArsR/SmtB family transcription factor [Thermomicrobiales bacterium]